MEAKDSNIKKSLCPYLVFRDKVFLQHLINVYSFVGFGAFITFGRCKHCFYCFGTYFPAVLIYKGIYNDRNEVVYIAVNDWFTVCK